MRHARASSRSGWPHEAPTHRPAARGRHRAARPGARAHRARRAARRPAARHHRIHVRRGARRGSDTPPASRSARRPHDDDRRRPLRVVEGGGRLIVVGTVTPFISSGLALADNALFATDLALSGGGSVAFDEYHHGVHPAASILAVVERTWPGRALLFAMAVVFLFVVLTGRRLGPPLPLDPRPPRSSLEYIRGFAGLVRRSGRQEIVRDRLRRELHGALARDAGLDPATSFERVVDHIRSSSPARADEAVSLDSRLRHRLREHELVRTVARVASLLHQEVP